MRILSTCHNRSSIYGSPLSLQHLLMTFMVIWLVIEVVNNFFFGSSHRALCALSTFHLSSQNPSQDASIESQVGSEKASNGVRGWKVVFCKQLTVCYDSTMQRCSLENWLNWSHVEPWMTVGRTTHVAEKVHGYMSCPAVRWSMKKLRNMSQNLFNSSWAFKELLRCECCRCFRCAIDINNE